ncbi:MAG: hypothetical protein HY270_10505 [Deltaproteobacteria bacterium]|nr:hypothetical protein [Deltaproteobacteria bacterium]
MPDADTLAAREKRVGGVFTLMLGAGLALDAGCIWCGGALIAAGLGLLAWGMSPATHRVAANPAPSTAPEPRP